MGCYINLLSYFFPEKATRLAYKFFSEPRDGKLDPKSIPAILKKAEIEIIKVEEHHFPIYKWKGNETKVLLAHGWESNAARWEPLFPFLQKAGYTILALDAPAHGLSSGKEFTVLGYAHFIQTVFQKYEPQILIGHSAGGLTSLYFQHHYQFTSLQKMVLLGSPSDLEIIIRNYANLLGLNNRVIQLMHQYFMKRFNINPIDFSGKKFASSLSIPGMLSHDIDDNSVKFEESKKIESSWKNVQFIQTKGLGHSMHDEALYQQIEKFLLTV
ncbi:alpha/beta hydrolase [Flavobacterium sp.]|uniref:alpha/beta hydrolase n=1 Tax=Flavobacterium sp. TaxID=239 RepID=UPI0035293986